MSKTEPYEPPTLPNEASELTPGAIIGAAKEDLQRRIRNLTGRHGGEYEHYAFHRKHAAKAETAAQLIGLALAEREYGVGSGKKWTRLIYKDKDILEKAYAAAVTAAA